MYIIKRLTLHYNHAYPSMEWMEGEVYSTLDAANARIAALSKGYTSFMMEEVIDEDENGKQIVGIVEHPIAECYSAEKLVCKDLAIDNGLPF